MFMEHGSFEAMEIEVRKSFNKTKEKEKAGGWYTRHYLQTKESWTKKLSYKSESHSNC